MEKTRINQLHAIAEFQKKLAWHNFNAAQHSKLFKEELLACAKQAADNCRETRQAIRNIIWNSEDQALLGAWADQGAPGNYWD